MPTQVICRTCGTDWAESDVSCPACGLQNPPLTEAEDLIASWVIDSPIPPESPSAVSRHSLYFLRVRRANGPFSRRR